MDLSVLFMADLFWPGVMCTQSIVFTALFSNHNAVEELCAQLSSFKIRSKDKKKHWVTEFNFCNSYYMCYMNDDQDLGTGNVLVSVRSLSSIDQSRLIRLCFCPYGEQKKKENTG